MHEKYSYLTVFNNFLKSATIYGGTFLLSHPTVAICNHFNSTDGIDLCVTFITVGYILYNNKCHQRDGFQSCLRVLREESPELFQKGGKWNKPHRHPHHVTHWTSLYESLSLTLAYSAVSCTFDIEVIQANWGSILSDNPTRFLLLGKECHLYRFPYCHP